MRAGPARAVGRRRHPGLQRAGRGGVRPGARGRRDQVRAQRSRHRPEVDFLTERQLRALRRRGRRPGQQGLALAALRGRRRAGPPLEARTGPPLSRRCGGTSALRRAPTCSHPAPELPRRGPPRRSPSATAGWWKPPTMGIWRRRSPAITTGAAVTSTRRTSASISSCFGAAGYWLFNPAMMPDSSYRVTFVRTDSGPGTYPSAWMGGLDANGIGTGNVSLAVGNSPYGQGQNSRWGTSPGRCPTPARPRRSTSRPMSPSTAIGRPGSAPPRSPSPEVTVVGVGA